MAQIIRSFVEKLEPSIRELDRTVLIGGASPLQTRVEPSARSHSNCWRSSSRAACFVCTLVKFLQTRRRPCPRRLWWGSSTSEGVAVFPAGTSKSRESELSLPFFSGEASDCLGFHCVCEEVPGNGARRPLNQSRCYNADLLGGELAIVVRKSRNRRR